jgi:predicted amidohydrolase YtcJ
MSHLFLTGLAILFPTVADDAAAPRIADAIYVNGKVWTVDPAHPQAQAIAVWRDRILAVGDDAAIRKLATAGTTIVDFGGKRVVPGFFDSHVHLLGSGLRLSEVGLKDAPNEEEFGRRLREFDQKLPPDRWLTGGEWDHDRALNGVLPSAELIDKYVPNRPVFLRRYDGHMGVANSRALKMAGITAKSPEVPGGVIYRKPDSKEPTGVLRDNAMGLVERLVPADSDSAIGEAVLAALKEIRREGVTSVEDMDGGDPEARRKLFKLYQTMARNGQLTVRVGLRWPISAWSDLAHLGVEQGFGDDWVKIGGLKGFMDGSLGSSTAKMYQPFVNEPGSTGVFVTPPSKMRDYVLAADRAGLAVAVHAIGDQANATMLDIFEEAAKTNGKRDRRFRIEHAQHLRPQDYPRFHALGVIPSMQPYHVIDDGRWAEGRIGHERCASSYAFRSLLDAGARLVFGSDWSVAPISALEGIDAAVNRRTLDGKNPSGWFPEQRITVAEAIKAYTIDAAYAAFEDKSRGSLEPGKLADFVTLSRDILDDTERDHITETHVLTTIVGGRVVYSR